MANIFSFVVFISFARAKETNQRKHARALPLDPTNFSYCFLIYRLPTIKVLAVVAYALGHGLRPTFPDYFGGVDLGFLYALCNDVTILNNVSPFS
ncbi:MAG: hypothetical protein J6I62_07850 [Selenomonadaceae bacterium]|nr:hypothetical protein [Selenomonadaceae bacterium]